jgi:hypothetical protein
LTIGGVAAEAEHGVGCATAEQARDVEGSADGEIGAQPARDPSNLDRLARPHRYRLLVRAVDAADAEARLGARQGDEQVSIGDELDIQRHDLEQGGALVVAGQDVGDPRRSLVERAVDGYPVPRPAGAAEIGDLRRSRLDDGQEAGAHAATILVPRRASYSSRSMARNRIRSPGS